MNETEIRKIEIDIKNDLEKLFQKYNIESGSICGTLRIDNEIKFIGLHNIFGKTLESYLLSVTNIGRMWQSAREKLFVYLRQFEK